MSPIFICQRCSQPLKLSEPLEMLASTQGEQGESQETGTSSEKMRGSEKLQVGASGGALPEDSNTSEDSGGFTLLGDVCSVGTLSSLQEATVQIFDILSGQKDVEHPLCEECTDNLLEQLDSQLTLVELDTQNYKRCLESGELQVEPETESLQAELRALELEEARLARELEDVDKGCARVAAALQEAEAETQELEQRERQSHREYSALKWQQLELCDQLGSIENQLWYAQAQLHWLNKTSIFQVTFEIREEGSVGIINNLRLGCLPIGPVDWNEINAAWGHVALLLLALSNTIGLEFQRYQLIPCADHSYLKPLTGNSALLPLFSDGSQNVFLSNKFDRAMIAFLDCLQQFKEKAEKGKQGLRLPYRIRVEEGLLEDSTGSGECCALRSHLNTREQWTRALKFMLVNLKCSLAWASLRYRKS
ncbi:beclin-2 [Oryctolagus cuniculus]|uniref:beclin-2 n=1 Tax=Oryctolagus cuniculus TaxID=9986 RepID=UPI00387A72E6